MRSIGRMTTVAAACVMALGLAACGSSAPAQSDASAAADAGASTAESGAMAAEGGTIYLVSKGFQHQFWQAVKEGAEEAGEKFGYEVKFVGPQDETKVTEQLDQLRTALTSGPVAIGFAALDSKKAEPVLKEIEAAGIPVIAFDSGVESDIPVTTVQTDNKAAAAEAAKRMVELLGGKGTVGLICHDQTSQTGKERCQGFQDYIKENAKDIVLIDPQYAGEVTKAADTAKAMIQANPDIVGLYGSNEAAATGAIQGATEAGKADLKVVGFDSGKTQIAAIKDGKQAGAITQAPKLMGFKTVEAAVKAIKGEKLEKIIDSGYLWYDKSNIDSDEVKPNLYE